MRRTSETYDSYSVRREQEAERDREIFNVLRLIRGKTPKEVALAAGVCEATVRKLRYSLKDGGTRRPFAATLRSIAESQGYTYTLQPIGSDAVPFEQHPEHKTRQRDLVVAKRARTKHARKRKKAA